LVTSVLSSEAIHMNAMHRSASCVTPGKPHKDSLELVLPIENSPPGIHAIPSGAAPGGVWFSTVGKIYRRRGRTCGVTLGLVAYHAGCNAQDEERG
jgi:hypothetical protein